MKIIKDKPPNWADIVKVFPSVSKTPTVVFAYGEVIYSPSSETLPEAILAHEKVHSDRMLELPGGPEEWWQRYLSDIQYRFEEELLAHCIEFEVLSKGQPRNARRAFLKHVSDKLSSPIYGPMCNRAFAKESIKQLLEDIRLPTKEDKEIT